MININRWQIVSDDSVWMYPPDVSLSTVYLSRDFYFDKNKQYESCIFFANGDSDVVARYETQEEAIAGHVELEKKYGLKRCSKLRI